ncbi:hypothetical protein ACOAOT_21720 [Lacrimispora sp. AGF001]|uniref:hypothetical protein n=1 Tax=Lacrimispora sp. AGF001 TaxID=3401631 RepID=UPI003B42FF18
MTYALIYENIVKNRFECENYELANLLARASFGNDAFATDTTKYASTVGDRYENNKFYHVLEDGTVKEVAYIPSEQENIDLLHGKLLNSQLVLADTYEDKLKLESKILKLEKMLVEMYEHMKGDN